MTMQGPFLEHQTINTLSKGEIASLYVKNGSSNFKNVEKNSLGGENQASASHLHYKFLPFDERKRY
jgi:hypothetical protein